MSIHSSAESKSLYLIDTIIKELRGYSVEELLNVVGRVRKLHDKIIDEIMSGVSDEDLETFKDAFNYYLTRSLSAGVYYKTYNTERSEMVVVESQKQFCETYQPLGDMLLDIIKISGAVGKFNLDLYNRSTGKPAKLYTIDDFKLLLEGIIQKNNGGDFSSYEDFYVLADYMEQIHPMVY